jgi:hypothetical protein
MTISFKIKHSYSTQINNMKIVASVSILAFLSCNFPGKAGSISVENKTGQALDSLVIIANGYRIIFYDVPANKNMQKDVAHGLIKGGHHIEMTPIIYHNGKETKGQYFYNDLSGFSGDYTIHIDSALNIKGSMGN